MKGTAEQQQLPPWGRLALAGAIAASQLLFPRKEKPRGSGLLPIWVLEGAKGQSRRELDHADSCQGLLFQKSQASTSMADCPGGSLLWLACLLRRSPGVAREGERGRCRASQRGHGDIWKRGNMCRRWLCGWEQRGWGGGENQILFFRLENAGDVVKVLPPPLPLLPRGKKFLYKI